MRNTIENIIVAMLALGLGMMEGFKWTIKNIKDEKQIYRKIIYIIAFVLDIILLPLKIIVIGIGMLTSKRFRETVNYIYDEMNLEDGIDESEL